MSVEVQVPTVPHFKGLISSIEDVGSPKDCTLQSQVMLFFMGSFGSKFDNGNLCANKNWTFL